MKMIVRLALAAALLVQPVAPALARYQHHHVHHRARSHRIYTAPSYGGGYYTAVSGHRVHRPVASDSRPSGATARCLDNTWSFSENHRGTCSHHGGVASWL